MDRYSSSARRATVCFVIITSLLVFLVLPFSKISFSFKNLGAIGFMLAICGVPAVYCWWRKMLRLAPALEALALGIFMTVPVLVATYMAASLNMPLTDDLLVRMDASLGFDWKAFIAFVDSRPLLADILAKAYSSFAIQLLTLPLILGATGRYGRGYAMILSYGIILYVSSIVSIWFPALGTYVVYGTSQADLQHINAMFGFHFLADFNAVRQQPVFVLSVANASGIITFPSCHAAGAFLCVWAAWDLKPLRYMFAGWNVLMAISAVSHANHYVVDVLAGLVIAAVTVFAVQRLLRSMKQSAWSAPVAGWRVARKWVVSAPPTAN